MNITTLFCVYMYRFFSVCSGEELLAHKVCEHSVLEGNSQSRLQRLRDPVHPTSVFLFLSIVVLICISFVTDESDYLFICW